jgi:3-methylcrotonyl-CoA carboxylase alpha subunit
MSRHVFILRGPGGREELIVAGRARQWTLRRGEREAALDVVPLPDGRLSILLADGRQLSGRAARVVKGEMVVSTCRGAVRLSLADPLHDRLDHTAPSGDSSQAQEDVRALMPGRVIEVAVMPGQSVEKGMLLLVLEAMKMQNEIRAERNGVVKRVAIQAGETVERGATLLTIQPIKI